MYKVYNQCVVDVSDDQTSYILESYITAERELRDLKNSKYGGFMVRRQHYYGCQLEPLLVPIIKWYEIDV